MRAAPGPCPVARAGRPGVKEPGGQPGRLPPLDGFGPARPEPGQPRRHAVSHGSTPGGQPPFGVEVRDPATGVSHPSGTLILILARNRVGVLTRFDRAGL